MSELTMKARKALDAFSKMPQPLTFTDTGPGEAHNLPGAQTGSIRAADGRALFVPVNESSSMLAAFPFVFDFFVGAPALIAELTEELEEQEARWRTYTPEEMAELEKAPKIDVSAKSAANVTE